MDRIGGALLLVKAVDIAARGPVALPTPLWGLAMAGWVAGAVALVLGRVGPDGSRACWGGVLIAGTGFAVDYPLELGRQHLVLLLGVALVAVVARDVGERLLLWRLQLSALYGVAALAKLNESFLGGDVLAGAVRAAPFGSTLLPPLSPLLFVLAGIGLILVEVTLAVTPWAPRRRRPGTALAICFHLATLVLVGSTLLIALRLVVFGGTAVLLHAASAGLVRPTA